MPKLTNRKGKIRLYDATVATPYYLELEFDAGDLSAPDGRKLPELINVQDKGVHDANAHYITGSEECHLEGLDLSFSILVTTLASFAYFLEWLDVLNGNATTVNSNTIVTTKGTTQNNGSINNPAFPDGRLACNIEVLLDGPSADQGVRYNEVYLPYPGRSHSEDSVALALAGKIFGTIEAITAFTAGTDVTI